MESENSSAIGCKPPRLRLLRPVAATTAQEAAMLEGYRRVFGTHDDIEPMRGRLVIFPLYPVDKAELPFAVLFLTPKLIAGAVERAQVRITTPRDSLFSSTWADDPATWATMFRGAETDIVDLWSRSWAEGDDRHARFT